MKKHILILGSTGFLGSNLIRKLTLNNKYKITGIGSKEINLSKKDQYYKLLDLYEPSSTIIFLSAVKRNLGDTSETYDMNTQIGLSISKSLEKKSVENLIYLSSCAVYGEKNMQNRFTESSKINPTSFYGASKVSNESLMQLMKNENKIKNLNILRPTTIYGDINLPTYCPSGFVGKALKNNKIEIWGNGKEKRDFFFINNFVQVLEFLIDNPMNSIINLVTGKSVSFLDLVSCISKHADNLEIVNKIRTNPTVDHSYYPSDLLTKIPFLKFEEPISWIEKFFYKKNNFD